MEVRRKLPFDPEELPPGSPPALRTKGGGGGGGDGGGNWVPMCRHACTFEKRYFDDIMLNLVRNPNVNSKWLFRADVLYDDGEGSQPHNKDSVKDSPSIPELQGFVHQRTIVRRLIPRNTLRDAPLDQTCSFYASSPTPESEDSPEGEGLTRSLTIYLPHAASAAELPYYHPKVRGVGQLHEWDPATNTGAISIHFLPFEDEADIEEADRVKLGRVAHHLLQTIHKHGHSNAVGYVKRVNHDVVVPRERFQDRYSDLKNKYARGLVRSWLETTDPSKHVFEDLGIAAFLIELWGDMYKGAEFPGFVDIGCGNGLLVHILREEGYTGWGFDARERKSWAQYNGSSSMSPSGKSLQRLLLLPSVVRRDVVEGEGEQEDAVGPNDIHNGIFPKGTFIISNHADELTPWTPILAAISGCPFIMIPCCSHNLAGDRWRAPPPRDKAKGKSTFASLVDWVTLIAEDCGWQVETEMLRIPSTRNTGLLGRTRTKELDEGSIDGVLHKYGGVGGYYNNVVKLLKSMPRGH